MIHEDWSVETPHHLASERIAVALGGHSSCVGLVDTAIPALRSWVLLMLRQDRVALRELAADRWLLAAPAHCCDGRTFPGAADAALHGRSIPHVAARFDADWDILTTLAAACSRAFGARFELCLDDEALWDAYSVCGDGFPDVAYLWKAGLSPDAIVAIHGRAGATRPLPRSVFTAVLTEPADPSSNGSSHLKSPTEMGSPA